MKKHKQIREASTSLSSPGDSGVAMSTGLDSYAAFEARAIKIGLEPEVIKLLKDGGVNSFGSYAFVTAYQPGQGDEQPLVDSLKTIMKRAPTATEMIGLRRLFFESCTLALSELQQRSENNSNPEPSKMPIAERNSRLALQRDRLKGVHFSTETEPSHKLADLVNQFAIDQSVEWLPWEKLTSRSSEITHSEKDLRISFDSSGNLKLAPKESANEAPVNGEMRIRQALARRARAFDLAELCSFTKMEEWHEKLFEAYQREPLPNAMPLSLSQLREADKVLFRKLAEKTRGSLMQKTDGTKPMEAAMDDLMNCAEVQFCLIPMVKQSRTPSTSFEHSSPKSKGKTKSPNKPKNDFQQKHAGGKGNHIVLPPGCHQMTPEGKPLCNLFNKGRCTFAKAGKRCRRGYHLCWKCFKPVPYASCDHGGSVE